MEYKDFTRFFHDKNYVRLKNNLFNYLNRKRLLKYYSKKYLKNQDNAKIADIGSGISPVTPRPKETLFIDISKEALNVLSKQGHKTLYGSVTKIPLNDKSLDIIFCSEVLEHVEDYNLALRELHRVTREKGVVFITVPCWMHYWGLDDNFVGHYRRFNPWELKREIIRAGFKVEVKKIGSKLDRLLTLQTVKQFNKSTKINKTLVYPYILANHLLSHIITLTSFLSEKKNSDKFLFICQKD
jgi:ubiquinone/menaquinone biosynthesis C-methylase UbiE